MEGLEYLFYQLMLYFLPFPLILGLVLFFLSRIQKKIKIIAFLIILPLLLRAIFGLYFFPPPLEFFLKIHSEILTKKAIESKNSGICLSIGELFPFFSLIPPSRARSTLVPLQKDCVIAVAVAEQNESLCDVLISSRMLYSPNRNGYKNDCYIKVAEVKKDLSVCERLEKGVTPSIEHCYRQVFLISEKYKDILAECRKIPQPKYYFSEELEDCIKRIAIETNNLELCKGIWSPGKSAECTREIQLGVGGVLNTCKDLLTLEGKRECIKNIAIERDDINLCALVSYGYWSSKTEECYKEIIFSGRRNSQSACEEFTGSAKKICEFEVAVNWNNISICKKGGPYDSTDWCYTGIAIKRKDPQICYEMKSDYIYSNEEDCFTDLALKTNNLEICKEIKEYQYHQDECVAKIAIKRNDISICESIANSEKKKGCLFRIYVNRNDLEICKNILNLIPSGWSYKDSCFEQLAIKRNDPKLCEYIEKPSSRDLCYKKFGIIK